MSCCEDILSIEIISNWISIITPFILLLWFYYSQRGILSKDYFAEIIGNYGGFVTPTISPKKGFSINSGIIMTIKNINSNGYFNGNFDFIQKEFNTMESNISQVGVFTFFGEINYNIYIKKKRHPFKPEDNRIYIGKIFIVDRLDFQFENYNIDDYLRAEYRIIHYREMQTLKFELIKNHKNLNLSLPENFVLYMSKGVDFEPYTSVKSLFDTTH
ncbi:MAG: hypothetical protein A3K10_10685 [Bacteroidetes bacterium RIFCSPLOWO2_12_FULL_31_6]|nr:MAG: hypothetical protein A3K10_10685 [Bacteroidetes bacterium RIFCSPLOWO2_12_FULL_31_6]